MIGGNCNAVLQIQTTSKNDFGAVSKIWQTLITLNGFLDFIGGNASYKSNYKGKLEETTHVFICDYEDIGVEPTQCRLLINDRVYDVLMIDNPMGLNEHLEIMLKYIEVIKP